MTNQVELQDDEQYVDVTADQVLEEPQQEQQPEQDDDLPDKYKGKSPKEIAKMHQEAEKLIGRHSQEVSELRRLADDLIKQQIKPTNVEPSLEVDFFDDPHAAVRKTVESSPDIQELKQLSTQLKAEKAHKYLSEKHGDYQALANSPDFVDWVKSNKNRVETFMKAQNNYDLDAADDLLTTFKLQKKISAIPEDQKLVRAEQMKAAGVENSGSGAGASKKIYRRADLIRLQIQDPRRYEKMQPEIMKAYAEKRVR